MPNTLQRRLVRRARRQTHAIVGTGWLDDLETELLDVARFRRLTAQPDLTSEVDFVRRSLGIPDDVDVMPRVRLWAVQANVVTQTTPDYTSSRTLPTFYLDPNVQGIVDADHARRIALQIVDPYCDGDVSPANVHVEPIY